MRHVILPDGSCPCGRPSDAEREAMREAARTDSPTPVEFIKERHAARTA